MTVTNNENLGVIHRWAFEPAGTAFDSSAFRVDLVNDSLQKKGAVIQGRGLTGTRDPLTSRTRGGLIRVEGSLEFDASPRLFDYFLPYVLGAVESTDTFAIAENLPAFDALHDPFGTGSAASLFGECYVNRMSLRFSSGVNDGIIPMTLDLMGKTHAGAQSFAGAALNQTATTDGPYMFYDTAGGITIRSGSGAQEVEEAELIIDNGLDRKFRNSRTATSIRPTDRIITLATNIPLTATTLSTYFGDKAAANATIVIDNGTVATTITLNNLQVPDESPVVNGKGESLLILRGVARADASNPSISVTVTGGSL